MSDKPEQVLSDCGAMDNPDNHPSFLRWLAQMRAAKIQQKNALQEQLRAVGMEVSALEKLIEEQNKKGV